MLRRKSSQNIDFKELIGKILETKILIVPTAGNRGAAGLVASVAIVLHQL